MNRIPYVSEQRNQRICVVVEVLSATCALLLVCICSTQKHMHLDAVCLTDAVQLSYLRMFHQQIVAVNIISAVPTV